MAQGRLVSYLGAGDVGDRPADPDVVGDALALWYAEDEGILYGWTNDEGDWFVVANPPAPRFAPVSVEAGDDVVADDTDPGHYIVFTDAAAVYTFDGTSYPQDGEYYVQAATGAEITLADDNGFTLTPPPGGTLVIPEGGFACIKIIAPDEGQVIGFTEAAP